jgi:hypothetical protein
VQKCGRGCRRGKVRVTEKVGMLEWGRVREKNWAWMRVGEWVCVHEWVSVCAWVSVCVCVCVSERDIEWMSECECKWMCVCECEWLSKCVCVTDWVSGSEHECMCEHDCMGKCMGELVCNWV